MSCVHWIANFEMCSQAGFPWRGYIEEATSSWYKWGSRRGREVDAFSCVLTLRGSINVVLRTGLHIGVFSNVLPEGRTMKRVQGSGTS
jgi:hypothetical protein